MKWEKRQEKQRRRQAAQAEQERRRQIAVTGTTWTSVKASPPTPKPEPEPTFVAGKVLGFRAWTLDGYKLVSANAALGTHWTIGANHAECRLDKYKEYLQRSYLGAPADFLLPTPGTHTAPLADCICGLHAYHEPGGVGEWGRTSATYVYGAVLAWGRIEVHSNGFRAEYAEPVLLAYDPMQPYRHVRTLQAVAGEMGLPLVELDELEKRSKQYGEPVAKNLRPEGREQKVYDFQSKYYNLSPGAGSPYAYPTIYPAWTQHSYVPIKGGGSTWYYGP